MPDVRRKGLARMTLSALLVVLAESGITLRVIDGGLRAAPPSAVTPAIRAAIAQHRTQLMVLYGDDLVSRAMEAFGPGCTVRVQANVDGM
jgi:protein-disulfide isomerase-like protein with CxxC motif